GKVSESRAVSSSPNGRVGACCCRFYYLRCCLSAANFGIGTKTL
ncbi:peptidase S1 and S6 chymotrypsin/Hap, partial [uncultured Microcoleus sp.]